MRQVRNLFFLCIALFMLSLNSFAQTDSSAHKVRFVTVEEGVQLEVLDWGDPIGRVDGKRAHRIDAKLIDVLVGILALLSGGAGRAHGSEA